MRSLRMQSSITAAESPCHKECSPIKLVPLCRELLRKGQNSLVPQVRAVSFGANLGFFIPYGDRTRPTAPTLQPAATFTPIAGFAIGVLRGRNSC